MRKKSSRPVPPFPAAVCAVALLFSSPSWAVQLRTAWASGYEASESPPANGEDALGRPDGLTAGFFTTDAMATYTTFIACETYDLSAFAAFLGVDENQLKEADFLVFERNGTPGRAFEPSTWTFSDGTSAESFQVGVDASVQTGRVSTAEYSSFFDIEIPPGGDWPFLLFNLQGIDPTYSSLRVTIERGSSSVATPDPDAMASLGVQVALQPIEGAYSQDFDGGEATALGVSATISGGQLTPVELYEGLGNEGRKFSGDFLRSPIDGLVRLEVVGLPPHNRISLGFLLAAIDSWDGTDAFCPQAPDRFIVSIDGALVFSHSFRNTLVPSSMCCSPCSTRSESAYGELLQSYRPPVCGLLSTGEAAPFGDVGFNFWGDGAYDMYLEPVFQNIPHTSESVVVDFFGTHCCDATQTLSDESWAIDNITIAVGGPCFPPGAIFCDGFETGDTRDWSSSFP